MKSLLKICKTRENAILPKRATNGSAGMDLYACIENDVEIHPGDLVKIPTGISISIPKDCAAFIFSRSGLGINHGISVSNGVGVVDSDYRGEICVGLCNLGKEAYRIKPNDRIAQMIVMKIENLVMTQCDSLGVTDRADKGFGSTGR